MTTANSLYIHIPFCKSKCPYCDFASWAGKENLIDKYFDALTCEINTKCQAYINRSSQLGSLGSIYIGGGTPSFIHPDYYEKLFTHLKKYFIIQNDCEVTLELNPGTARTDYLSGYKKLGINRISIGAQSFNKKILQTLGRKHSVTDTIDAINKTKETGFNNFSLDLIFSVPGMTKEIWTDTIHKALKFDPKHISSYSLTIEAGTPFAAIYKDKKLLLADDFSFELYSILCNILKEAGFIHYEVSNFSRANYESKHNLNYWNMGEYFSFGLGSHRFINGLRTSSPRDFETYITHPCLEEITDFPVNHKFEKVMLNSRLKAGIDIKLVENASDKTQHEIKTLLKELSMKGLVELSDKKIHLTDEGMFINNEILLKLM